MTRIARSTLIIAFFFGLEKVLGLLRNVLVAQTFGLSAALDAYNVANNLPDLIFALIIGGALSIALIPVLSETLEKEGRPALWELFARIANLVFLITALLSLLVALFAQPLVERLIAPGFDPEQQLLVAELMRLNLIATLFFSLGGLLISGLQANQHFILPALAPSLYDLGALFGILILVPEQGFQLGPLSLPAFGLGVHGMLYGTILGAALFFLVQLPALPAYRFRWIPAFNLRQAGVARVFSLLGPRILMVLLIQVVFIAQDNLASYLSTGTVTALVYGWMIMQFPETIIGTTIGTVLLPTLSEQAARGQHTGIRPALSRALRWGLPLAILLILGVRSQDLRFLGRLAPETNLQLWVAKGLLLAGMGIYLLPRLLKASLSAAAGEFPETLQRALRSILALTIPSAVLLMVVIRPFVSLLGFEAADLDLVAWTARAFLLGLVGHSLLEVSMRAFYAQQDAHTPLIAYIPLAAVYILAAAALSPELGAAGFGLANSLAFSCTALILWHLLARGFPGKLKVGGTLRRTLAGAGLAGAVAWGAMQLPLPALPLALGAAGLGALAALPFIWPEIRLLLKL